VVDPRFERRGPREWPHHLRLVMCDGRVLEGLSPNPPGGEDAPLGAAVLRAKARDLVEGALGPGRLDPLLALLAEPAAAAPASVLRALQVAAREDAPAGARPPTRRTLEPLP
jgi:hypothetical protein